MAMSKMGMVYLVGAGPGNPGLLTLRGAACLRRADLVLYDQLASSTLLDLAPSVARRVCVRDLADNHRDRIAKIHDEMVKNGLAGQTVVRLKGGDPTVFGRAGEEAESLRRAGVPYEIVPGVTTACAAAAYAGIPLTHRNLASAVAFIAGHEDPEKPASSIDWQALASFPGTLVFYMGLSRLEEIATRLGEAGLSSETTTAVVEKASTGEQRTIVAPLHAISAEAKAKNFQSPALVMVGPVVGLRERIAWFDRLPLFGRKIVVARPPGQNAELASRLIELGGVPLLQPAVEILPLLDFSTLDRTIASLPGFHWLVFTSVNGVSAFIGRLRLLGRDLRALGHLKFAAIGPATADAIRAYHLEPDVVPQRYQSEDLADSLMASIRPGERVLLARADRGREVLRDRLSAITEVEQVAVYRQVDVESLTPEVATKLRSGLVDFILLSSSNIARSILEKLDDKARGHVQRGRTRLVTISPVTSDEVRRQGFDVSAEATSATSDGLIDAAIRLQSKSCE